MRHQILHRIIPSIVIQTGHLSRSQHLHLDLILCHIVVLGSPKCKMSVSDSLRKADGKFDRTENDVVYLPSQMAALLSTHTAFVSLDFTPNSTSDRLTRIEILDEPEKLLLLFVPRQGLWVDGPLLDKPCTELGVLVGSTISTSWNISTSSQADMSRLFS